MKKYFKSNLPLISFIFIPIIYLWDPSWLEFVGVQPYWPLFWLLPWAMVYGSMNGLIVGLFLAIILDSISPDSSLTQIPGLVLCGIWFGKLDNYNKSLVGHFKYGLICSIGSFLCGILYYLQILYKHFSDSNILIYLFGLKNIFAQLFITGLLAPFFCSYLLVLFKKSNEKNLLIQIKNK